MRKIYFLDSTSKYGTNTANHDQNNGNDVMGLVLEKWGGPLSAGKMNLSPGRWGAESYSVRLYTNTSGETPEQGYCFLKVREAVPNFTLGFALKPRFASPHHTDSTASDIVEGNQWLTFYDNHGVAKYGVILQEEGAGTRPTGIALAITQPSNGNVWAEKADANNRFTSPVLSFDPNKWHYFEINIASGSSFSTDITIKLNGTPIFQAGDGTYNYIQSVKINSNYTSSSGDMYLDGYYTDFYVADGFIEGASTSRVWVPEHRPLGSSIMYQDVASGDRAQWGLIGADFNYQAIRENPHSSGQYVYATATGLIDLYGFPTPSSVFQPVGNIHGIAVNMGLMPMGSTSEVKGLFYRPATNDEYYFIGSGVQPEGEYRVKQHIMAYNPVGTSVWLPSEIGSGVGNFGMLRAT